MTKFMSGLNSEEKRARTRNVVQWHRDRLVTMESLVEYYAAQGTAYAWMPAGRMLDRLRRKGYVGQDGSIDIDALRRDRVVGCTKVIYATFGEARSTLATLGLKMGRDECRIYECEEGCGWHLTSRPRWRQHAA